MPQTRPAVLVQVVLQMIKRKKSKKIQKKQRIIKTVLYLVPFFTMKAEFERELEEAGDRLVAVDFTADWCKMNDDVERKINEAMSQWEFSEVIFLRVDVDDNEVSPQRDSNLLFNVKLKLTSFENVRLANTVMSDVNHFLGRKYGLNIAMDSITI